MNMSTVRQNLGRWLLVAFCTLVFAFLILPVVAIIPISFNSSSFLVFPQDGVSLRWYRVLAHSPVWMHALGNSLVVAAMTTVIAAPLGTLAAIGLRNLPSHAAPIMAALLSAPMIIPVVVVAIALYFLFAPLGLANSFTGLVIAHTILALPFVVIVVHASLHGLDRDVVRAALSLGAHPVQVFVLVIAPLLAPGIAAGAVFAFMTSFDETIVALFIAGPEYRTLPVQMFEGVREQISPAITAAATLLLVTSTLLLCAAEILRRRGTNMQNMP